MTGSTPAPRKLLAARRLVLLASVAALGAAALFAGPGPQNIPFWPTAQAQVSAETAARPVGFADIVERVKPAVIGVRVKSDQVSQRDRMQFNNEDRGDRNVPPGIEEFFRRFGAPGMPNFPRGQRQF